MELQWQKCQGDIWGPLLTLNLGHEHFNNMEGVYIIWQGNGPVIRIGQGVIRDRLSSHRQNGEITSFSPLYVTWASVPLAYRDGVEKYLANILSPKVGDAFPDVVPIKTTLPWPWSL